MAKSVLKPNEFLKIWLDEDGRIRMTHITIDLSEADKETLENAIYDLALIITYLERAKLYFLTKLQEAQARAGYVRFRVTSEDD